MKWKLYQHTLHTILLITFVDYLVATHCDKGLNICHENYGYGFNITCDCLTDKNENMIGNRNMSVYNKVVLKINNSNLTKVTSNTFSNVQYIKYLIVTNSTFCYEVNQEPFKYLHNLEHLTLQNTILNNLSNTTFQKLENLKELNLLNNSLEIIEKNTFKMLQNLEILKLSDNGFKSMRDVPVCELPTLKYFHIDYNQIQNLEKSVFFCENKKNNFNLNLNGKNYTKTYNKATFLHYINSNLNLIEVNLSHNNISKIENLDWGSNIKRINLEGNRLKIITDKLYSSANYLEELNLKNNLLEDISPEAFAKLVHLKYINLENNHLIGVHLKNLSDLNQVVLSKNKLLSSSLHLNNLPKLQILLLNENSIRQLFRSNFQNFSSLKWLDLSDNHITLSEKLFRDLSSLQKLIIKNNSLEVIPVNAVNYLSSLQVLDISANKLTTINDPQTFVGLDNLQVLNMSHNFFEYLTYEILKPLHNLQVFDIAGNRLQNLQFDLISYLPSITLINIKDNLLLCDVLSKIIAFFKSKDISYIINNESEYDKQNIDGIYCGSDENKLHISSIFIILFTTVVSSSIVSIVFYKFIQFSKRRTGYLNEIELIEDGL